jgi:hypothetical protein
MGCHQTNHYVPAPLEKKAPEGTVAGEQEGVDLGWTDREQKAVWHDERQRSVE